MCVAKCAIDYLRVWPDPHCDKTTHFVYLVSFLIVSLWLINVSSLLFPPSVMQVHPCICFYRMTMTEHILCELHEW